MTKQPPQLTISSPAKINWFLAITGQRKDGFHEIVSIVSPLTFGDHLTLSEANAPLAFTTSLPDLPCDERNLVVKAIHAFQQETGITVTGHYHLEKNIPVGAGLGGGSGNAATMLKHLRQRYQPTMTEENLTALASSIGSDVPLFLHDKPMIMRGRGEKLSPLPSTAEKRLRAQPLLLFMPEFGISTPWAYNQLRTSAPVSYSSMEDTENTLHEWLHAPEEITPILFNSFEEPVFRKYLTYDSLFERMREEHGLYPLLSGSGSCCFVPLPTGIAPIKVTKMVQEHWGKACFIVETQTL